jgi:ubiquitin carboxyl-terminal hydrolase 36/42
MSETPRLRVLARGRQEDAHEALRLTVEALQHCGLRAMGLPIFGPRSARGQRPATLVERIFGGTLTSRVTCCSCGATSDTLDCVEDLSLELAFGVDSLPAALRVFTKEEKLEGDDAYRCEKCKQLSPALKRILVAEAPNVLVLHLKRFRAASMGKVNTRVNFQEALSLDGFTTGDGPAPSYRLYAVTVHSGWSATCGHYYSYVRDASGDWYMADDSSVRRVKLDEVLRSEAYLLAYIREPSVPVTPLLYAARRARLRAAFSQSGADAPPGAEALLTLRARLAAELRASPLAAALRSDLRGLKRKLSGFATAAPLADELLKVWEAGGQRIAEHTAAVGELLEATVDDAMRAE